MTVPSIPGLAPPSPVPADGFEAPGEGWRAAIAGPTVVGWRGRIPGTSEDIPIEVTIGKSSILTPYVMARIILPDGRRYAHQNYSVGRAVQSLAQKMTGLGVRLWILAPGETL